VSAQSLKSIREFLKSQTLYQHIGLMAVRYSPQYPIILAMALRIFDDQRRTEAFVLGEISSSDPAFTSYAILMVRRVAKGNVVLYPARTVVRGGGELVCVS
jgi:hypothetical protein